jgi:transposase
MKLSRMCQANFASEMPIPRRRKAVYVFNNAYTTGVPLPHFPVDSSKAGAIYGIITLTLMPTNPTTKRKALQAAGTFNPRAAQVRHPLFQQFSFFDPEDLLQLKYETLRAVEIEQCPIAKAARDFGLSRPTIYDAQTQLQQQGLEGLLPHKRGPKAAHKLTGEILQYVQEQAGAEPEINADELAKRVRQRFAVKLHPRTIQKALSGKAKRGHPA